ncbi:Uncharacterized protein TCM_005924 [Theobroma cacao]|uniref:Uncharacterized protein n=1 Tax=Theobroma cacao TaxID=3641 RepID=A0A061E3B3_THECC|nr:Uncharacterized protein TCM_005924 [Theobroma cacao]
MFMSNSNDSLLASAALYEEEEDEDGQRSVDDPPFSVLGTWMNVWIDMTLFHQDLRGLTFAARSTGAGAISHIWTIH